MNGDSRVSPCPATTIHSCAGRDGLRWVTFSSMQAVIMTSARDEIVGDEYVARAVAKLRNGDKVGEAELRVPKVAVDESLIGKEEVVALKSALEVAVQAMARANARAAGH